MVSETSRSAWTSTSPIRYTLLTCCLDEGLPICTPRTGAGHRRRPAPGNIPVVAAGLNPAGRVASLMTKSQAAKGLHHLGLAAVGGARLRRTGLGTSLRNTRRASIGCFVAFARAPVRAEPGAAAPLEAFAAGTAPWGTSSLRALTAQHWTKTQGRVGHPQDIVLVGEHKSDIRGHTRPQLEIGIVHVDDGVVGNHVLHSRCSVANLANRALERLAREGVHGKGGLHACA